MLALVACRSTDVFDSFTLLRDLAKVEQVGVPGVLRGLLVGQKRMDIARCGEILNFKLFILLLTFLQTAL